MARRPFNASLRVRAAAYSCSMMARIRRAVSDGVLPTLTPAA